MRDRERGRKKQRAEGRGDKTQRKRIVRLLTKIFGKIEGVPK